MTDPTPAPEKPDLWNKWLFRVVNIFGILLIAREALLPRVEGQGPSIPILLVGLALITGATGINLLLKGLR